MGEFPSQVPKLTSSQQLVQTPYLNLPAMRMIGMPRREQAADEAEVAKQDHQCLVKYPRSAIAIPTFSSPLAGEGGREAG